MRIVGITCIAISLAYSGTHSVSAQTVSIPSESAPVKQEGNKIDFEPSESHPHDWETSHPDDAGDKGGEKGGDSGGEKGGGD
jgi:hypothetical protein